MPSAHQNRTGRKTGQTNRQGGRGGNRRRRRNPQGGRWKSNPYVTMVADPCNSTLVPGLYGSSEGLLARLKASVQAPVNNFPTCGYLLWCPDYSDVGYNPNQTFSSGGNIFMWSSDSSTHQPWNTDTVPYGTDDGQQLGVTAQTIPDPAANLLKSDIVSDARVLSACLQMTYFGKMQDSSGEVGFVSNLPVQELLYGGKTNPATGNVPQPFSVDDLLRYVNVKQRLGVDTLENVYRLNELSSEHFRSEHQPLVDVGTIGVISSRVNVTAQTLTPRVFGFVWRNVQPGAGLTFDLTKSIEWRAEASSGIAQVPIRSSGPSMVPHINQAIDRHASLGGGSLWHRVASAGRTVASQISKIAFTGVGQRIMNAGQNYLKQQGARLLTQVLEEAPLLLM